jgi:hypothetical protein
MAEVAVQPVQDFLINLLRARRQVTTFEHRMTCEAKVWIQITP